MGKIKSGGRKPVARRPSSCAHQIYRSIDWAAWWQEFTTSTTATGALEYSDARHFAQRKAKNQIQLDTIYYCIGPEPNQRRKGVPYLGDWDSRRGLHFGTIDDPDTAHKLIEALKESGEALDHLQAVQPFNYAHHQHIQWMRCQLTEAFAGHMFQPGAVADSRENLARGKAYLELFERIHKLQVEANDQWLRMCGRQPSDVDAWLKIALQMTAGRALQRLAEPQSGPAPQAPQPVYSPEAQELAKRICSGSNPTPTALLMSESMLRKSKAYGMPSP